jgi:dTDP-4-dehydrorhamnose 3,5-epimerase
MPRAVRPGFLLREVGDRAARVTPVPRLGGAIVPAAVARGRARLLLHIRAGDGEAKLVRCSFGAAFDVIVDLRPGSATYRNWESFELRDADHVFSVSDRIIAAPVYAFRS